MSDPLALPSVVLVTGTGTEVGKTVATAAVAAVLRDRGRDPVVVKVAQTGVAADEPGDVDEVRRLAGDVPAYELLRLDEPLAPETAARLAGVDLPPVAVHAKRIGGLVGAAPVLVEGAGGLLVRLDSRGGTLADLGVALRYKGISCGVLLVAHAALGTLNVAALTAEALKARSLPLIGVVVGGWPAEPGLAERCNLEDLPRVTGAPLLGCIPYGVGSMSEGEFRSAAPGWLDFS